MQRMHNMKTRTITGRGLTTLAGAAALMLSVFSSVALGDGDASKIRWDIIKHPNLVVSPGGVASALAADKSMITLTGSGTFEPGGEVTGGGAWATFDASGKQIASGKYRIVNLVTWHPAPGTLPCPPVTDTIGNCADATAGLAVFRIQYSNGGLGKLVVSCHLPVGSSPSTYEGLTVSKGFVDYYLPVPPDPTGNGTLFHVVGRDDD
jgi:hypothetical protein